MRSASAWIRRRPPPGRIFLHRPDGLAVRRELPARALETLLGQILEQGGAAAARSWQRAGHLPAAAVLAAWPAALVKPDSAMLGSGEVGIWLEASFAPGAALHEIAEDLARALLEQEPLEGVSAVPEPVDSQEPARVAAPTAGLARDEDPFALDESASAGDLLDSGLEVRPADLPGLNPGDRLYSPRRGTCVIVRVNPALDQVLLRDAGGLELPVTHAELTAEFSFQDAEIEIRRD